MKNVIKKVILAFLLIVSCVSFFMCGIEPEEPLIEKSIDGIAEYLGYTDGKEIEIPWDEDGEGAGAKAGKTFNSEYGKVTIFEFDPNSSSYNFWKNETSTCVDGFVILFDWSTPEEMTDYDLMRECEKIESIKFKEDEN
ncbi:hypothetical protein V1225_08690 [Emergencia sp. JLR.KK010]|uniref:hypothetical protein n=1 Tax=Anaerovoracaceae TaxID=543314 RepID=UPI002040D7FD|nr:hypothetical protein [Senimuribacter intestinalis]